MKYRLMAVLLYPALFAGCASIINGGKQEVVVDSTPTGARIEVNGAVRGNTPSAVLIEKKGNPVIVVKKDGYRPVTVQPTKEMSGWFWGNIVLGGLFGSSTDAYTGAINNFAPSSYFVTLEPEAGPARMSGNLYVQLGDEGQIKSYILTTYESLAQNIAAGSGQHLETLYQLLKVPLAERAEALNKLKGILVAFPNIIDFANGVLTAFPPPAVQPAPAP